MKFLKYEFTPTQWATAKAKITLKDEEGNESWDATKVVAVVELGHLCTEWGTDEDGNQVCTKKSTKVAVDILWADKPLTTSFASYVVWPAPCGIHVFAGWEQAYAEEFCKANPDADYCKVPNFEP
jgi:hypothetical protein